MDRQTKEALRVELAEKFQKANGAVIAEYRGLTVAEITQLRVALRKAKAEFKVVKARVAKKAIEKEVEGAAPIVGDLKGPIGVVYAYGDAAQAAKAVFEFEKEKSELFKVTAGLIEGKKVTSEQLKAIADLPSKEVLLAQIIGSLVAPHRGLLNVLSGVPRNVVQVINAIKEKKA